MELLKTEAFTFEERQYEIHLYGNAWDFTVHVYLDGKPANGYSYSVSLPTAMDLRIARDLDAVRVLIDDAKRDIENKAWEKYVEAYIANLKKVPSGTIGCRR